MNAASPSIKAPKTLEGPGVSIRGWVDALSTGSSGSEDFLWHLREIGRQDAESIWEALALLDQAFRSRRISREVFFPIKSDLQQFALRGNASGAGAAEAGTAEAGNAESGKAAAPFDASGTQSAPIPLPVAVPAPAETPAASGPIRVGTLLRGRYRVIGVLGAGDAGTVCEAIDELRADAPAALQRIAIRVLDSRYLQESGQMSAYLRHVCNLQMLSHPNLLRVFDFDQDGGRPFLTMELLTGSTLPQLLAPSAAPLRFQVDRRHVLGCVASALQFAHSHGIVHGDLRAEEIFITLAGDVRLLGLDRAFNRTADEVAKDHLAFAWLVRQLLGGDADLEQLRRPPGVTRSEWRALEAVILGRQSEGARLLQLFAGSGAAPGPSDSPARAVAVARGILVWGLLPLVFIGAMAYIARDHLDFGARGVRIADAAPPRSLSVPGPAKPQASVAGSTDVLPPAPPAAVVAEAPPVRASTINVAREFLQVDGSETVARVRVLRHGNLASSVSFVWWTESGSAEPGVDFQAVAPRSARFPANRASVELFVPLVPGASNEQPVTFYVKIDEAGEGARLGGQTLAQVSIVPAGFDGTQPDGESVAN